MRSVLLVSAVAALAVAGCSGPAAPAAAPSSSSVPPATTEPAISARAGLTAARAFGDVGTVDVCGLVDRASLPAGLRTDSVTLDPFDTQIFGRCAFATNRGGGRIGVEVGPLLPGDATGGGHAVTLEQGVRLSTATPSQGSCAEFLVFPDEVSLAFGVSAAGPPANADLCAELTTVAKATAARLFAGHVGHLSLPPNSYAKIDPCTLLSAADISSLAVPQPDARDVGHHECDSFTGPLVIELTLGTGPRPAAVGSERSQRIGGRAAVVFADNSTLTCSAATGGPPAGGGAVQVAIVQASPTGNEPVTLNQVCDKVTAVAGLAWPKLPAG